MDSFRVKVEKMKCSIVLILTVIVSYTSSYAQEDKTGFINKVNSYNGSVPDGYVPPLVSNGSLSMLVDYMGGQSQKQYVSMTPVIYWAGRRYGPPKDELIPFGYFEQEYTVNGQVYTHPNSWEQILDTKQAVVTCKNDYGDDFAVETIVFSHLFHDLIVIKKRFYAKSPKVNSVKTSFKYQFSPPGSGNVVPKRVVSECSWNDKSQSVEYQYETDGYKPGKGIISVFSDKSFSPFIDGQFASLVSEMEIGIEKPAEITYYLLFADSMDGDDYQDRLIKLQAYVRDEGFDGLLVSHTSEWKEYWDESFVNLPDKRMEQVYNTAQYHLRANATNWSFPVGIFTTHWAGRYFGWDEMFCFQALASSNHLDISKRCPEFRRAVLPVATRRITHYNNPGTYGAQYPWETLEDGYEGAPNHGGFWLDHVFHMSNIALSAWLQYLYSADLSYLSETGYPVIKECARFYVSHMVYENADGSMFIGKCTDLERLGPAKQNPFMTACGAIYTLDAAGKASDILGTDGVEAKSWKRIAEKLRESLPNDGKKYVPYSGCTEQSVASLGGLFPYPLFDESNLLQKNAVYDFLEKGKASGNMYPVGNSICAWYAGWMAAALDLLGDKTEPAKLLKEAANGAGYFSDLFEINEPKVQMHPWFSTASGNYVYALNQMLVQSKNDLILIAPAVPDSWNDFSFKLACFDNLSIIVSVKGGEITRLDLISNNHNVFINRTLIIPERLIKKSRLKKLTNVSFVGIKNGFYQLDVDIKSKTSIIIE